jgi:hypothetical protein
LLVVVEVVVTMVVAVVQVVYANLLQPQSRELHTLLLLVLVVLAV